MKPKKLTLVTNLLMKQIFLLALGALALATINSEAFVDSNNAQRIGDLRGRIIYAEHPNIDPKHIDDADTENTANANRTVEVFHDDAVRFGAENPEEIDQFVKIAWYA